jgi:gluconate 2-dehydrogenase gamma chain
VLRFSRRVFIQKLTFLGGGVVLLGGCKRSSEPGPPKSATSAAAPASRGALGPKHLAIVTAAVDRILPRDEDPGALDADVPAYIDRALTTPELRTIKPALQSGLDVLDRRSQARFNTPFASATPQQRDELLEEMKNSSPTSGEARFWDLLVSLTMEGFLGDPSYGGNRDQVGWKLVGFNTSAPPHGYQGSQHLHHSGRH